MLPRRGSSALEKAYNWLLPSRVDLVRLSVGFFFLSFFLTDEMRRSCQKQRGAGKGGDASNGRSGRRGRGKRLFQPRHHRPSEIVGKRFTAHTIAGKKKKETAATTIALVNARGTGHEDH
jgi:hypothetical protein